VGFWPAGAVLAEAQRVADEVGELDHLIALVVMAEDDQTAAERCLCSGDAAVHLVGVEAAVPRGQRLTLVERGLLDLVQHRKERLSHRRRTPGPDVCDARHRRAFFACELVKLFASYADKKANAAPAPPGDV